MKKNDIFLEPDKFEHRHYLFTNTYNLICEFLSTKDVNYVCDGKLDVPVGTIILLCNLKFVVTKN
jgi:hypothetical protein